jgi:hypothetical protein
MKNKIVPPSVNSSIPANLDDATKKAVIEATKKLKSAFQDFHNLIYSDTVPISALYKWFSEEIAPGVAPQTYFFTYFLSNNTEFLKLFWKARQEYENLAKENPCRFCLDDACTKRKQTQSNDQGE